MKLLKATMLILSLPQFWIFAITFTIILSIASVQNVSFWWAIPAGWQIAGTIRAGYDGAIKRRTERE